MAELLQKLLGIFVTTTKPKVIIELTPQTIAWLKQDIRDEWYGCMTDNIKGGDGACAKGDWA